MVYNNANIGTMSTDKRTKINQLLNSQPYGVVFISSYLDKQGYNLDLLKRYRHNGWLTSIGSGALIRAGDTVDYLGGIYALQSQARLSIHPGGKTALALLGKAHFLNFSEKQAFLYGNKGEKLPTWFKHHNWGLNIEYHTSSFLPPELELAEINHQTFSIKVSGAARALMECLYLSSEKHDLLECYEIMEGLTNLRPNGVQKLLEACTSVKVKRLFLFMADKANHAWFKHLDATKIDLGSGKRSITKKGVYVAKYEITVPEELAN